MSEASEKTDTATPQRSRAVFSPQDFELIKVAIQHYLKEAGDLPEASKYSNLYHRLGRII